MILRQIILSERVEVALESARVTRDLPIAELDQFMENFELASVGQHWDVLACSPSFLIAHEFFDVFFFIEENDT